MDIQEDVGWVRCACFWGRPRRPYIVFRNMASCSYIIYIIMYVCMYVYIPCTWKFSRDEIFANCQLIWIFTFLFSRMGTWLFILFILPITCINLKQKKMAASLGFASCVRGDHVYQEIWTATEGQTLLCNRDTRSRVDSFAVAVILLWGWCLLRSLLANWHPWSK